MRFCFGDTLGDLGIVVVVTRIQRLEIFETFLKKKGGSNKSCLLGGEWDERVHRVAIFFGFFHFACEENSNPIPLPTCISFLLSDMSVLTRPIQDSPLVVS